MLSRVRFALLASVLSLTGCGDPPPTPPPASPAAAASTAAPPASASPAEAVHAAAGVVPGSHEDWCVEHAVPESQCTRCNAKLIPAFKATKDWCVEHNLPESQCLLCNPSTRIVRPPKAAGK